MCVGYYVLERLKPVSRLKIDTFRCQDDDRLIIGRSRKCLAEIDFTEKLVKNVCCLFGGKEKTSSQNFFIAT